MKPWLTIIGMGEDGPDGLGRRARTLIDEAEILIGGERLLALIPENGRERLAWPSPMGDPASLVARHRGRRVCVLATGDPLHYGVGVRLVRALPAEELTVLPAPSAFSLACARMGWPRTGVETLSLHGRPFEAVLSYLHPGARLLILGHDGSTPARLAETLSNQGYGRSRLTVLERMGGPEERRIFGIAANWPAGEIADFHILAVECLADPGASLRSRLPGLPDDAFRHDGQITKREIRAATLSALAPAPGQLLWDVGAGCGSIAIEWMRTDPRCRAVAVEGHPGRCRLIAENAEALGVPGLRVVTGAAPGALDGLEPPDAVFIGGGLTAEGVFEACWSALSRGGRLAANAVTLEGEALLQSWHAKAGGELTRLAVARAEPLGRFLGWHPLMPVTRFLAVKP